ncbi:unnamed protein product [Amoebophrya sp. A120]|nr:unnamed protein product [Amoebophrya sp. A120]|eukprot:GSA120T00014980001.1
MAKASTKDRKRSRSRSDRDRKRSRSKKDRKNDDKKEKDVNKKKSRSRDVDKKEKDVKKKSRSRDRERRGNKDKKDDKDKKKSRSRDRERERREREKKKSRSRSRRRDREKEKKENKSSKSTEKKELISLPKKSNWDVAGVSDPTQRKGFVTNDVTGNYMRSDIQLSQTSLPVPEAGGMVVKMGLHGPISVHVPSATQTGGGASALPVGSTSTLTGSAAASGSTSTSAGGAAGVHAQKVNKAFMSKPNYDNDELKSRVLIVENLNPRTIATNLMTFVNTFILAVTKNQANLASLETQVSNFKPVYDCEVDYNMNPGGAARAKLYFRSFEGTQVGLNVHGIEYEGAQLWVYRPGNEFETSDVYQRELKKVNIEIEKRNKEIEKANAAARKAAAAAAAAERKEELERAGSRGEAKKIDEQADKDGSKMEVDEEQGDGATKAISSGDKDHLQAQTAAPVIGAAATSPVAKAINANTTTEEQGNMKNLAAAGGEDPKLSPSTDNNPFTPEKVIAEKDEDLPNKDQNKLSPQKLSPTKNGVENKKPLGEQVAPDVVLEVIDEKDQNKDPNKTSSPIKLPSESKLIDPLNQEKKQAAEVVNREQILGVSSENNDASMINKPELPKIQRLESLVATLPPTHFVLRQDQLTNASLTLYKLLGLPDPTEEVKKRRAGKLSFLEAPVQMTESQLRELFLQFGELKYFELMVHRDGGSKGYGMLEYEPNAEVDFDLVFQCLNGFVLEGKALKVQHLMAQATQVTQQSSLAAHLNTIQQPQTVTAKLFKNPLVSHRLAEGLQTGKLPSTVVQLLNCVSETDLLDEKDYQSVKNDITSVAKKYGVIEEVRIPRPSTSNFADTLANGVGKVFVHYANVTSARRFQAEVNGRKFDNRVVCAAFYPSTRFAQGLFTLDSGTAR